MVNQEEDYFEQATEAFARFFVIKDKDYDLIRTYDGKYFCRNCLTKVKSSQKCPNCNKSIDWSKRVVTMKDFVIILLKGDKSDTDPRPRKEFYDNVTRLIDDELISLHEELYDNPKKQDIEMIKATNWEVDRRYIDKAGFFKIFRQEYKKWNNLRKRTEVKATKFVIENIQKQK